MRIRIVRPLPAQLEGVDVRHLVFGAAYDLTAPLCDLMIVMGFAVPVAESAPPSVPAPATPPRFTPPLDRIRSEAADRSRRSHKRRR